MDSGCATIKNVLVTGNLGYIGSVLVPILRARGFGVVGLDTDYYGGDCRLLDGGDAPDEQIRKDIRDIAAEDLEGVDAVVHLAALSNDPLGELRPEVSEEVNFGATLRLAELAREAGVHRFVYSSSQSMYGIADVSSEVEEDRSEKNPLTVYARTKWRAECALLELSSPRFTVTAFRPSTVFGLSPKLRLDIVFNNLVACALATGRIEIKSDGTPWRPVVHVRDVSSALLAGLVAPRELVAGRAFNVGIPDGNFTVRQLAEAAQQVVPGSRLRFTGEHGPDSRTYRVSFERILTELRAHYEPAWGLVRGGEELVAGLAEAGFSEGDFRSHRFTRLSQLQRLLADGRLDSRLRWVG